MHICWENFKLGFLYILHWRIWPSKNRKSVNINIFELWKRSDGRYFRKNELSFHDFRKVDNYKYINIRQRIIWSWKTKSYTIKFITDDFYCSFYCLLSIRMSSKKKNFSRQQLQLLSNLLPIVGFDQMHF